MSIAEAARYKVHQNQALQNLSCSEPPDPTKSSALVKVEDWSFIWDICRERLVLLVHHEWLPVAHDKSVLVPLLEDAHIGSILRQQVIHVDVFLLSEATSSTNRLGHPGLILVLRGGMQRCQEDDVICTLQVPERDFPLVPH